MPKGALERQLGLSEDEEAAASSRNVRNARCLARKSSIASTPLLAQSSTQVSERSSSIRWSTPRLGPGSSTTQARIILALIQSTPELSREDLRPGLDGRQPLTGAPTVPYRRTEILLEGLVDESPVPVPVDDMATQLDDSEGTHMWHIGNGMAWWMLFGTLFEILVVVAVVILIAHYLGTRQNSPDGPVEIVERRYATGEITREQFDQLRREPGRPANRRAVSNENNSGVTPRDAKQERGCRKRRPRTPVAAEPPRSVTVRRVLGYPTNFLADQLGFAPTSTSCAACSRSSSALSSW